ncbi:pentatricopeptide repeat-containing protein [Tripterygium wilfordii]|uniref:Pentatricopeptide repeat-containing protein n=1 Tax=Tripterygium wilfordii TaxID=458696 RepID=A0A7J7D717_TRIWF|nr:pentatricopeptide repeat-containing protein At4g30825, chloroplastic [Tripterygium wilfordii]XP_038712318.1 pentatricopeptide repeat-containing protein At4g30825, chloroplastic [Tripterygium wilfordii]KAF5742098.1 pentatricopeptide repeat-containing protein [Tripterygium wilfordii]
MASLRLSIFFDTVDPKRSNFSVNPIQFPDRCSISSYIRVTRPHIVTFVGEFSNINVSGLATESSEGSNDNLLSKKGDLVSETMVEENPNSSMEVRRRNRIGKRGAERDKGVKFTFRRNRDHNEGKTDYFFVFDGELDVNYSAVGPDLSLEQCNMILKRLEKCGDSKTLRFFEWMRSNGKLEKNVSAYNLVFRVLGRKEDWDAAEKMVRELSTDLGFELNFQVFNTVIYACCKRGRVDLVAKWFQLMLELEVKPNVATFGMVMGLYQKGWKIEEAEFAFRHMRSFGIICQSAYSAMITIYTRLNLYDKAEETICLMREDKVVMNAENWLVLLNAYSQQGKLEEAEQVLVSMQEAGISSNIVAYNTLITGYGKVSNMDAAQCLFLSLKSIGLEPDEATYRSMIEGWGRAGNYLAAERYYKDLKRLGYKPNSSNLYTLINLQAKHGDKNGAIRILNDMLKTGCQYSSIISTLLQAYERAGKIDMVPLLLRASFYQHILVNQTSCFMVVTAYVKHRLVDDAIMVLRDKKWEDKNFEDNLYHLLICSCKDSGNLENAVKIYTQMPKSDDKPNLHISCTMIDVYGIMGLFTEAEKVYMNLKSSGIALDMITFSVVVRLYVKSGSLSNACSVLETIEMRKDIIPDIHLFRDMLRIYQRCGMLDKLAELYYKILKSGITWDKEMYICVINCCARALPVNELSRLFDEMLSHGFTPNTITFNVMLDVYGKSKLFNEARKLFWMAKKQGLVDVISYNTIFAAYGQNRDFKNMSSTIRHMQFDGFSVSLEVYNCMLDVYGKEGQMENFRTVLQRMKEVRCASDHYTYNIMVNIYGKKGWIDEVADVLTELSASGLKPDLCTYNTLIKAYGIAGMVEDAVALVKEMRDNRIEPDKITYTNLINTLQKNDEFLEAVRWSLWMKQMGL